MPITVVPIPARPLVVVPLPARPLAVLPVGRGLQGVPGPAGLSGDLNATHLQATAADTWQVTHNLGKRPSVTVVDSAGDTVEGNVSYLDGNHLTITFSAAFSGSAFLN